MGGNSFGYLDFPISSASVPFDFSKAVNNLLVSPNPAYNEITLNTELTNAQVFIFNSLGEIVIKLDSFSSNLIDISKLASGAYLIAVQQNGKVQTGALSVVK
jgi:hypothetical protein